MRSPLLSRIDSSLRALPRWARYSAAGVLAVAIAGLCAFVALRRDPVERALARGDVRAARVELRHAAAADAGKRSYDAARVAEAQKSYRTAAMGYATAPRLGEERGLDRLIALSRDRECPARTAAAAGLAKVRDQRAVQALQQLRHAKFASEARTKKARHAPVCDSRRAARLALKHAGKA